MSDVHQSTSRGPSVQARVRAWFRRHWLLDTIWRVAVFLVGIVLVVAGLALLVLPGPGWAMIAVGLVVLASEYAWPRRLLRPIQTKLRQARATAADPRYRRHVQAVSAVVVLVAVAAVAWYLRAYGWTLDGVRGWWPL